MMPLSDEELAALPRLLPYNGKHLQPEFKIQERLSHEMSRAFRRTGTPITQVEVSNSVVGISTGIHAVDQRRRAQLGRYTARVLNALRVALCANCILSAQGTLGSDSPMTDRHCPSG